MSDDASPSSAARSPDISANGVTGDETAGLDTSRRRSRSLRSRSRRRRKRKSRRRRNPGLAKKLVFITHLLKSLDTLVFAELSALYYMECSMFRFILRACGQYMYLTPKDEAFPFLSPASRTHVLMILIPNIFCMLLHLFGSLPIGPDYFRGYMHGGMIIDFVGQKPPTSRLYYCLADMVILVLQCLMLTVHTERERLRVTLKTFRPLVTEVVLNAGASAAPTMDDLDAEERGVSRELSGVSAENETDDIELRPLNPGSEGEEGNEQRDESESPLRNADEEPSRSHLSDILSSGNAILGEYHMVHTIRSAALDLERTAANSIRTLGYGVSMAAIEARRGANIPIRGSRSGRQN